MFYVPDWDTRRKRKIADITQALSGTPVDVAALRRMAISEGGLLTDEIRCKVWPKLLNVPLDVLNQEPGIMILVAAYAIALPISFPPLMINVNTDTLGRYNICLI